MNRKYWLVLSLPAVVAPLAVGCSSKFDTCEERRTCAPAGKGGKGGGGHAGTEDAAAGEAGADEGGRTAGGGSGGRAITGGDSGDGGDNGEGGAPDDAPALFDACSVKGAFACVEHGSAQRLACDGKLWQAGTTCAADQLCDSATGKCAQVLAECAGAEPGAVVCRNDALLTCGPDLVTASEGTACEGRCKLGVCQAPTCGDGKVEKGEACEDSAASAPGLCVKCKEGSCGDGVLYAAGEQCDDGNKISGDGCSSTCHAEPVALALGNSTTCALSSTGLVKCWGDNSNGQLGLGDTNGRGRTPNTVPAQLASVQLGVGRKVTSIRRPGVDDSVISIRGSSACAVLDGGDLKCWGYNYSGQLGSSNMNFGDDPGEMSDALKAIPLGAGLKAVAVSVGYTHTCVVLDNGTAKCWGLKTYGQLGQDPTLDASSPKDLPAIKFASPITAISASNYLYDSKGGQYGETTCALLDDGSVRCWGYTDGVPHDANTDSDGSHGIGDAAGEMSVLPALTFKGGAAKSIVPAKSIVAGAASAAILADDTLRIWGGGTQLGQPDADFGFEPMTSAELAALGPVPMGGKVKSVALGRDHACAILDGGGLKCWGSGSSGQLGLGATITSAPQAPAEIPFVDLGGHAAKQVATGAYHTCAILDDGTLRCWGYNAKGQLGLGIQDETTWSPKPVDLSF